MFGSTHPYCGFARKADLYSAEFCKLIENLQEFDLGELSHMKGWLRHWSRRWEFPWCFDVINGFLRDKPGEKRILESGCGVTPMPFWLASQGHWITGIDLDQSYATAWKSLNVSCRPNPAQTTFTVGDMEALPFEDGTFDLAYSVSALEHTNQPDVAVSELCRVVKSGGGIVITCDVDIQHSKAIHPGAFFKMQKLLKEQCLPEEPLWHSPQEILTFENRTIEPQSKIKRAVKHFLDILDIKVRQDFCIYAFAGSKI